MLRLLGVDGSGTPLAELIVARDNIAPSEAVAIITNHHFDAEHPRQVALFTWGLVPFWTKRAVKAPRPINVRAESLLERPIFHSLIARHRGIIPAAGFYEWKKPETPGKNVRKTPYFLRRADGQPMALAAVWETQTDTVTGARLDSCAIVTTEPSADVREIHDRMPVILEPRDFERWLTANDVEPASLRDVLRPSSDGALLSERLDVSPGTQPKVARESKAAKTSLQLGLFDTARAQGSNGAPIPMAGGRASTKP